MKNQGTLAEAAALVGLSRESIYRVVVTEGRIPAKLIRARRHGRNRPRWILDLAAVQSYFLGEEVLRDNCKPKGGLK